jgi:S-DNA-T family DNA segregation ATPase FtsK/SpoIIIE
MQDIISVYRQKLQNALNDYGINGRVVDQTIGPSVVRYKVQLGVGVIIPTLTRREREISTVLECKVSITDAPSGSRGAACYVSVPNPNKRIVSQYEIENCDEFKKSKSTTSFAVGQDMYGESIIADLKDMPHMIVGGTVGSGKSVFLNSMLLSLISYAPQHMLEMILIDPKGNEFSNYAVAPHLMAPIITDSHQAVKVLDKMVQYMELRYELLAEYGCKSIDELNNNRERVEEIGYLAPCVIVIDELSDLMMASNKAVEQPISRLAQKARACGIYLVIATQRPAKTVVTGLISDNIPSRIAFAVADSTASRIILGKNGAEKLLGKGDMLYSPIGSDEPIRVQGAYADNDFINRRVANAISKYGKAEYNESLLDVLRQAGSQSDLYSSDLYSRVHAGGALVKFGYS